MNSRLDNQKHRCLGCKSHAAELGSYVNHSDGSAINLFLCHDCECKRRESDKKYLDNYPAGQLVPPPGYATCQQCGAKYRGGLEQYVSHSDGSPMWLFLCPIHSRERHQIDEQWAVQAWGKPPAAGQVAILGVDPAARPQIGDEQRKPLVEPEIVLKKWVDEGGLIFDDITTALLQAKTEHEDFKQALGLLTRCADVLGKPNYYLDKARCALLVEAVLSFLEMH